MWLYNDKVIEKLEDFGEKTPFGFVYITTHIPSGISYIGKKACFHNVKRKLGKKEIALHVGVGRKPKTETIHKESDWKTYYGSAKPILEMLKDGKQNEFKREIIHLAYSKKLLTYYEMKYLFHYAVLEHPLEYFNENINGTMFRKDFDLENL